MPRERGGSRLALNSKLPTLEGDIVQRARWRQNLPSHTWNRLSCSILCVIHPSHGHFPHHSRASPGTAAGTWSPPPFPSVSHRQITFTLSPFPSPSSLDLCPPWLLTLHREGDAANLSSDSSKMLSRVGQSPNWRGGTACDLMARGQRRCFGWLCCISGGRHVLCCCGNSSSGSLPPSSPPLRGWRRGGGESSEGRCRATRVNDAVPHAPLLPIVSFSISPRECSIRGSVWCVQRREWGGASPPQGAEHPRSQNAPLSDAPPPTQLETVAAFLAGHHAGDTGPGGSSKGPCAIAGMMGCAPVAASEEYGEVRRPDPSTSLRTHGVFKFMAGNCCMLVGGKILYGLALLQRRKTGAARVKSSGV